MSALSPLEYRRTRGALRDAMSLALDELDGVQSSLAHGDPDGAREHARRFALAADDCTSLCERLCRLVAHNAP